MIGNPKWFEMRKFGWGLKPKSWEGWVYIGINILMIPLCFLLPINDHVKLILLGICLFIMFVDSTDIMIRMKKDERETINEAVAERNASWFMIFTLTAAIIYQALQGILIQNSMINIPIISIILGACITKALTYWHLNK